MNEKTEKIGQQLYTDKYFEHGHWLLKIEQTLVALIGWVCVVVPIIITARSYIGLQTGRIKPWWSYSEGFFEIKFIGILLLFCFAMVLVYSVFMTIIQNRKRDRLVEQWPTFDPIGQHEREDEVSDFFDQQFGSPEFCHSVRFYEVKPEQNLDTHEIKDPFKEQHSNEIN